MNSIEAVFTLLDRWRHFPAYQLERRADIFFAVYLKAIVEAFVGEPLLDTVIPELPIKRDLIWPERKSSQSVKVDYALFPRSRDRVYFVELKTDAGSRREDQDTYLTRAKAIGFRAILAGLLDINLATKAYQKYYHLIATLADLGFFALPGDIEAYLFPKPRRGLTKRLHDIELVSIDPAIDVIYVQPEATDGDRVISFADFAAHVRKNDDPLSQLFAEHLMRWRTAAGALPPGR